MDTGRTPTENYHVPLNLKDALKQLATDPNLEKRFDADIHRTVKNDDVVIQNNKAAGLSAYCDPFSVSHKGDSGSGKTYITKETFSYFPPEDIIEVATQSPKVISHEQGVLTTFNENGEEEPLNLEEEPKQPKVREFEEKTDYDKAIVTYNEKMKVWNKKLKDSFHLIDFTGKIYVILESAQKATLEMLKTTMSHDGPRITHKYVDDKGKVHKAVLQGAPAFIFCSIDEYYYGEFATRVITDTPDTSEDKIIAGKQVIANKKSFPWKYNPTQDKQLIMALIRNIRDTIKKYNLKFINPFPNSDKFFSSKSTRDMRDFDHFLQLLSARPIFSLFQRPIITVGEQKYFVATVQDFIDAKNHFDKVYETTITNTDQRTLTFYHEYVQHHVNGATIKVILSHPNLKNKPKTERTARNYLSRLEELGWVDIHEDEQPDKRQLTFYPLKDAISETEAVQTKIVATKDIEQKAIDLKSKLTEDFETWRKTIETENPTFTASLIQFNNRTEIPLSDEQFSNIISLHTLFTVTIVLNGKETVKPENKPKTIAIQEKTVDALISDSEKSALGDTEKTLLIIEPSQGEPCEYAGEENNHASESQVELDGKLKHYCNVHMALVLKGYNPRLYQIQYGNQPETPSFGDKEPCQ